MFGLFGRNGLETSSLMRMLAMLQSPHAGSIYFDDINILQNLMTLRKKLGYWPQEFENLDYRHKNRILF